MLVLSRKLQEQIKIGEEITITVLKVKGNTVRIGIAAPKSLRVVRAELPKLNPTSDSAVNEEETAASPAAEIKTPLDPLSGTSAEEPLKRAEELRLAPSAMLVSLRRLRKHRTAAPLKNAIGLCAALAK